IGANTVAFEDGSLAATAEIVVYDLATNTATRLTNDSVNDINPSVSADGNSVAWEKCLTGSTGCDIYVSHQTSPGVWSTTNISLSLPIDGEEVIPSISGDGRFVAFSSTIAGESDIFVWDGDTDTTYRFDLPGVQRSPAISGDGRSIIFESNETGAQYDIYVADNPLHDDFII